MVIYFALPICSAIVSILLQKYILSMFSVFRILGGEAQPAPTFYNLSVVVLTFVVYFICTLPALLIRFLLLRRPIEKKFLLVLASSLFSSVGTICTTLIIGNLFGGAGTNLAGIGLFVFLGTYMLLGLRDQQEENESNFVDTELAVPGKTDFFDLDTLEEEPTWYFYANGQTLGPYSKPEMMRRARKGRIAPETLVWSATPQSGNMGWITAQEAGFTHLQGARPPAGGPIP